MEAVNQKSSLGTLYGGIVGLGCLGVNVIRAVLLPQLPEIHDTIQNKQTELESFKSEINYFSQELIDTGKKRKFETIDKQREYIGELENSLSMCKEGLKTVLGKGSIEVMSKS